MRALLLAYLLVAGVAYGQTVPACSNCAVWNAEQKPFRIYGNTYYVGPHGLASILVVGDRGDVLIDGALPESATRIAEHIRELGFRVQDVKLILSTHVHFDHAGGIAELQRMTGARVVVSDWSAKVLREGGVAMDDPQFGSIRGVDRVAKVETLTDGETLRVGDVAVTAHLTPGHTGGGTSWTWRSCEGRRCLDVVYADSLSAISAEGYRYSDHADLLAGFAKSFTWLESTPCDVLLTPHWEVSEFWGRVAARDGGKADALVDHGACKALAERSREALAKRLATEAAK